MALVTFRDPLDYITGKLSSTDDIYFRRQGNTIVGVRLKNPRTKFSEKEIAIRATFGQLSKQASAIFKDPMLSAPYKEAYEAQKATGIANFYRFILAELKKTQ